VSLSISVTIDGEGRIERTWLQQQTQWPAETEDLAGSSDAAAAAGMRPPRPVDWAAAGAAEDWQMANASAEAAAAVGAVEDGPEAAAEAEVQVAGPPAKPADLPTITKRQRGNWYRQGGKWR